MRILSPALHIEACTRCDALFIQIFCREELWPSITIAAISNVTKTAALRMSEPNFFLSTAICYLIRKG